MIKFTYIYKCYIYTYEIYTTMIRKYFLTFSLSLICTLALISQENKIIIIKADKPLYSIQPTMWGVFFEDINFAADGGLHAELVKNRSFEFFQPLMGWKELKQNKSAGSVLITNRSETLPSNPRFAHITVDKSFGSYGLDNSGFRGMGIKQGMKYHFSLLAGQKSGDISIRAELVNGEGKQLGTTTLVPGDGSWNRYTASLTASATDPKASLRIWFEGNGSVDVDMISLFPDDTWKDRPGGLRSDLVQLLADLKPGFIRFPGGCIVGRRELATRYQWKKTVGPVEERELIVNRWNTEFAHKPAPDYFQSFGLGFFEYFQLAEDLGAEPLPILSCGMACQFNTAEVVPLDQIDPYIQDALDLIEFANGPVTSRWGKLRADMGHPAPFHLKMLGVGNEQWGAQYIERYRVFASAIKAKYPQIQLVSGTGPSPDGADFEYASAELKKLNAELVDEHYYRSPEWFFKNAARYDNYDRNSYKIFAGEYASHIPNTGNPPHKNTWLSAISEAAFMTGLERNADVVWMCSYAPLFAHSDAWQWSPDLIWFNNLEAYGTPNYYVQKLFSTNKGTHVLSLSENGKPLTGLEGVYASSVFDNQTGEVIIKIVNATENALTREVEIQTSHKIEGLASLLVLKSEDINAYNSFDNPLNVHPKEQKTTVTGRKLKVDLAPSSLNVVKLKIAR